MTETLFGEVLNATPDHGVVSRERIVKLFPHFAKHSHGTQYQLFLQKSLDVKKQYVDVTVFYREPTKHKVRVDARIDELILTDENRDPRPEEIRILQWGLATTDFYDPAEHELLTQRLERLEELKNQGVSL